MPDTQQMTIKLSLLSLALLLLATISGAQTTTVTLTADLNSKLPTGTIFTAKDSSGKIYQGYLITHRARRFLRSGSMVLVFTDPVVPVMKDPEGVIHGGNKMRLLKLGGSLAAAKLADDAVDTAIGASKARYVAIGVAAMLIAVEKGQEAKLHAGDTIEVVPRRTP